MMATDLTLWRWLGALILVLVLMGGLVVLLQMFGPQIVRRRSGNKGDITVRDSMAIDPRRRLLVVSWKNTEYLLLLSPQGEQVVGQQPAAKERTAKLAAPQRTKNKVKK